MEAILNEALAAKQQNKSQALKYLIRPEHNQQCYAQFCQHTKPKSAGGLAYINIMNADGITTPILEQEELETTLLEHSQTHFAQVEGSPFTVKPLSRLLQYDGLTKFGNGVTEGRPIGGIHNFDEPTKAILSNLKWKIPHDKASHPLNYATLLERIKKWPENTTMSPSGCHLGIYKALGKHVVQKEKNTPTKSSEAPPSSLAITQGRDILYAIFDIMLLAICHEYPLQ